jgi:hypothetical protein
MKAYEHEESPWDDMFKGTKTYKEVLERVQTLSSGLEASFQPFKSIDGVVCPKYYKEKQSPSPRSKKMFPQDSNRKHRRRAIPKKSHRIWKGPHKTKRPYRQNNKRPKQRGGPGDLPSPVSLPPLHHLVLMSICLRE